MKMHEFICFFKDRETHYEISDSFASDERYRQKDGGYIETAQKKNIEIDIKKAEPNQKWHLINCYYDEASDSKKDAKKCYMSLRCPELLLWIAEAAGVTSETVEKAATEARTIIDSGIDGRIRNKAGLEIKKIIPWEAIESKIRENK